MSFGFIRKRVEIGRRIGWNRRNRIGHRLNALELSQRFLFLEELSCKSALVIGDEIARRANHGLLVIDCRTLLHSILAGIHGLKARPSHVDADGFRATRPVALLRRPGVNSLFRLRIKPKSDRLTESGTRAFPA